MGRDLDWIADLPTPGAWRDLAAWLVAHRQYLAPCMAALVDGIQQSPTAPTERQISVLVQARASVEAVQVWADVMTASKRRGEAYAIAATSDADTASAAEGAKLLAPILKAGR